jgi:2,4-dienoyl-CoA reductase-like NADH-dependent reductase (Old Yellow Enzyme family)
MSVIFEPMSINNMEVKNRIVRSATYEGMADEIGAPTESLMAMTENLARGEVGLVVPGFLYVSHDGKGGPLQTSIATDETVPVLKKLVDRVHQAGGKVCAQIVHCGRQTHPDIIGGETPIGPSPVTFAPTGITPREMTGEDIRRVINDFGEGARRVKEAGFDAVQIHSAHGYLLSAFNSGFTNRRTDEYGGSLENRMRMVVEVYRKVREVVGPDYPVMVKMNSEDYVEGGITIDESKYIALRLAEEGIDAIEMSGGIVEGSRRSAWTKINTEEEEGYYLSFAEEVKKLVGDKTKVIAVGGFKSPAVIEKALQEGKADFVALSRPLIREPDLVKKWKEGDMKRADCISCNLCLSEVQTGGPTRCHPLEKERAKLQGQPE